MRMVVQSGSSIISAASVVVVVVVTLLYILGGSSSILLVLGKEYMVGDSLWSIPPTKDFYTNWSSSHSFLIGDTLLFEFDSELHDVMQVSIRDYENCSTNHPFKAFTVGPATVPLIEQGVFYFICSVSNYCQLGQRLAVAVHNRRRSPNFAPPTPSPSPSSALQFSLPNNRSPPHNRSPPPGGGNAFSSTVRMRSAICIACDNGVLGCWAYALCLLTFTFLGGSI